MSSADAQLAYQRSEALPHVEAQDAFSQQFDLSSPDKAMSSYQRLMHQHTKQQFQSASDSSRRRSSGDDRFSTLSTESSNASVDSNAS